jgi:hypothetical protein
LPHFLPEYSATLRHPIKLGNAVEITVQSDCAGDIAECASVLAGDPICLAAVAALADFKAGSVKFDVRLADE